MRDCRTLGAQHRGISSRVAQAGEHHGKLA